MRKLRPSRLFKYKSVSNEEQFEWLRETIVEKKLYFPTLKQLNDPMEACSVHFVLAVAGSGYHWQAGKVDPIIEEIQEQFGILSFTTVHDSPIMWAHYGKDYTGCCLIFSSKKTFAEIEPTIYSGLRFERFAEELARKELEDYIRESFLFKDVDWAYENEWRYVNHRNTDRISFEEKELEGVIVGEKMDVDFQNRIASLCREEGIPCFRTYMLSVYKTIGMVPVDLERRFITRFEANEFMREKEKNGLCVGNEYELFEVLNNNSEWTE